ncbi:MAG: sensor histidine kinase [Chitinophagales bacterium]|nr:sensor histidine kinase [Chitinophagales bacterium]
MRSILLALFLLFGLSAQTQSPDSLRQVLTQMPADTHKVQACRALYLAYYERDEPAQMLPVAEEGLALSRQLNYLRGVDLFLFYKASALDMLGRGKESLPLFEEGIEVVRKLGDREGEANYHINAGVAYYSLGQHERALQHYLSAYALFQNLNLPEKSAKLLNNIGLTYRAQGKPERAEEIYRESLRLKTDLKDTLGIAASYINLAGLLLSAPDRTQETETYARNALEIFEKYGKTADAAACYALLADIYLKTGDVSRAQSAALKAKAQYDTDPDPEYSANVYEVLGKIALGNKAYTQAEQYFQEGTRLSRQFGQQQHLLTLLQQLAETQHQMGKSSAAYLSLREAGQIRDALSAQNQLAQMEEMQARFDVAQKDNALQLQQLRLAQRTAERNWFILGAAMLALLALSVFFVLRQRIRHNQKLAAQESALQQQQLLQAQQAGQLAALQAMLEGQEQERSRIAADLHDGLGGLLTSVKSHFNSLAIPDSTPNYGKTNQLLDEACGEVRRIAHNMMPRALSVAGLPGALDDLARNLQRQGINTTLEMPGLGEESLDPARALMLYRIIQELCSNLLKHARAQNLLLQLILHENRLHVIVEDDGQGFDLEQAMQQKGMGLASIQSRVQFLQGNIHWDTRPGQGCSVSIELPV